MEVIIYASTVFIIYLLSCTIFLPLVLLIKVNKTAQNMWFAFIFPKFLAPRFGPSFAKYRKCIFKFLHEHQQKHNKTVPLEVLEIGIGHGANLAYYPENVNLTSLDMNESFLKDFHENAKKYPNIKYVKTVINFAENMTDIDDQTFDVVISTHVLCSVKDVKSVLKEVKRVLKPGGKYIFMEHSTFPDNDWKYFIQKCMAPLWNIYCDGCNIARNQIDYLYKAKFSEICLDKIMPSEFLLFFRPHVLGIATK